MKRIFYCFKNKRNNNSGIILLTVLWILTVLSILAISLGRRTQVDLSLVKYSLGDLRAEHLAMAGFMYALNQIHLDSEDDTAKQWDTLYQCGVATGQLKLEDIFKKIQLSTGYFDIFYKFKNGNQEEEKIIYGLQDEERRININVLNQQNYKILKNLLVLLEVDEEEAETVSLSIVDWIDADNNKLAAEDDYYMELERPYHCKNRPIDSFEELLLVNGVTEEIWGKLKGYVTLYPKTGNLVMNYDTATFVVLQAVARYFSGAATNTDISDADSLVEKIAVYRKGEDGLIATGDDKAVDANQMDLNAKERVIFLSMAALQTKISRKFRIKIKGIDENTSVRSNLEAVVDRDNFSVLSWQRN